jgi:hypothetical protein
VEQKIVENNTKNPDENEALFESLSTNPTSKAIRLVETYPKFKEGKIWSNLLANPKAMKLIIPNYEVYRDHNLLHKNSNPIAFQLLNQRVIHNYNYLSENPSSRAIKLLKEQMKNEKKEHKIYKEFSKNRLINWERVSKNPRAKSLILAKIKDEEGKEQEIEKYRKSEEYKSDKKHFNWDKYLNWDYVSANPAIFTRTTKMKTIIL